MYPPDRPIRLPKRGSFDKHFDMRSFGEPIRALRAMPIRDTGEELVDLRIACPEVILRPGCLPFLRKTVAAMTCEAQRRLPAGHTLVVGTCLRTREMQRGIRNHLEEKLRKDHPEWSLSTLNRMLNRMVAPPDDVSPPPHMTGGALDVGVCGPDGCDLAFSVKEDHWKYAATYHNGLPDEARENRIMLIDAMEGAGLTNYVGEWWHWSYGDQGWALRVGHRVAFYDAVEIEDAEAKKVPKPEPEPEAAK